MSSPRSELKTSGMGNATAAPAIETANLFLVAGGVALTGELSMLRPPRAGERITAEHALNLAAYLVALVPDGEQRFAAVLHAVQNS